MTRDEERRLKKLRARAKSLGLRLRKKNGRDAYGLHPEEPGYYRDFARAPRFGELRTLAQIEKALDNYCPECLGSGEVALYRHVETIVDSLVRGAKPPREGLAGGGRVILPCRYCQEEWEPWPEELSRF